MPIHPSILRAYDIRGIVGETLDAETAVTLGHAFGTMMTADLARPPRIAICRDGRLSSPMLQAALIEGACAAGADVTDVGCGPTPMLYYAAATTGVDAGIMVTGSHNPPDHNGFKMTALGKPFYGDQVQDLGRRAAGPLTARAGGRRQSLDIRQSYVEALLQGLADADIAGLRIGWDPGNGAAGEVVADLIARLPGTHVLINGTIDGRFPAHHPDPTIPDNLRQLQQLVAERDLDLGFAFDGDGDRLGAVDAAGRIVWGDQLLAILAGDVLQRHAGATIIADVKTSQVLFDRVAKLGGKPLMWRTGHSLIKAKMAETGAPLAGEMSGHIFFADDYFGFDDGIYAAMRLLRALGRAGQSLGAALDALPVRANTPEIRIDCPEERKFAVIRDVATALGQKNVPFDDIDGIRVTRKEGWWLLRASNTQAAVIVRAEAADQRSLQIVVDDVSRMLSKAGVSCNVLHATRT